MRATALPVLLALLLPAATAKADCDAGKCASACVPADAADGACDPADAGPAAMAPPEEEDPGSCSCLWNDHERSAPGVASLAGVFAWVLRRGTRGRARGA